MMRSTIAYLPVSNQARDQHITGHRIPCNGPVAGHATGSADPGAHSISPGGIISSNRSAACNERNYISRLITQARLQDVQSFGLWTISNTQRPS